MILFKNKNEVIEAYKDIGRPLGNDLINELVETTQELRNLGLSEELVVMDLRCRICDYKQAAIIPAIADLDNLECGYCGNMTSQEADAKQWWED